VTQQHADQVETPHTEKRNLVMITNVFCLVY